MRKASLFFFLLLFFPSCSRPKNNTGLVKIALENFPSSLDPRVGTDQVSQRLHQVLYRGLVKRTKNGNLVPDLASSYRRQGDRTFIFKIKKNLRFCNGKEITPKDVVYTYRSLLKGKIRSIRRGSLWMIEDVFAKGQEVIFRLKKPYSSFLINTTLGIVPHGAGGNFAAHPVGSGPYCVGKISRDEILLKPNPYQRGAKNRGILVRIIPDEVTRALEITGGDLDLVVNGFSPDTLYELSRKKNLVIKRRQGGNFAYIGINLRDKYLKDRRIRLAIGYAIDRRAIIKNLLRGYATEANTIIPPYLSWHEKGVFAFHYDPSLSANLLRETGHQALTLEFSCASRRLSRQFAQILKSQLERVGITLKINCGEFSYFYSRVLKGNFQLYFMMWVGISDPDIFRFVFHSKSTPPNGANRGGYSNPEVDRLIEEGERTYDFERRKEIYSKIQKIVAKDVVYIPLWYPDSMAVYRKGLRGVEVYPNGDLIFLPEVHY